MNIVRARYGIFVLVVILSTCLAACWTEQPVLLVGATDTDTDADTDTDTDTDTDADTDSDTDTGPVDCEDVPGYCCNEDCPCNDDYYSQCALTSWSWEDDMLGVCKEVLPDGGVCWTVDDCWIPEHVCADAFVCGCNMDCTEDDYYGSCIPGTEGCCDSSSGNTCSEGYFCMPYADGFDVCHHVLNDNLQCWTDDDCAGGAGTCEGAQLCSCNENCISVVGHCNYD